MPNNPIQEPTPEQHEALHKIIDRLPRWSEQFEDHTSCTQTITSLRSMLDSQGRISEQHHKRVQELAAENERAVKKVAFWKTASAALRQRTVDLYDRYDNRAAETYERVFNSILDTEEDPNPAAADDERDRWLIDRTWLSTLSAVLDFMPTED